MVTFDENETESAAMRSHAGATELPPGIGTLKHAGAWRPERTDAPLEDPRADLRQAVSDGEFWR